MLVSAAYLIMRFCFLQDLLAFVNQSVKDCENRQVRAFITVLIIIIIYFNIGWPVACITKEQAPANVQCRMFLTFFPIPTETCWLSKKNWQKTSWKY